MAVYLGLGAKHIQTWLPATPRLRLMRGASLALEERTRHDAIRTWLDQQGWTTVLIPVEETGDVAGVIVLRSEDAAVLSGVAPRLLLHLHQQLPGLHWEAWQQEADTYVAAFNARETSLRSLPDSREHGFLRACPGCGIEPAAVKSLLPETLHGQADLRASDSEQDDPHLYGVGCAMRFEVGEKAMAAPPEGWRGDLWSFGRPALNFERLASRSTLAPHLTSAVGRGESSSHLALISADANRLGALFKVLATSDKRWKDLREGASKLVNDGIQDAVVKAAGAAGVVSSDGRPESAASSRLMPVEVHYVGGDDVLATVPARAGWAYADALMAAFDDIRTKLLEKLPPEIQDLDDAKWPEDTVAQALSRVSLGVGLVFAHRTFPYRQGWEIAQEALDAAKKHTRGERSAVGYADLSVEGSGAPLGVIEQDQLRAQLKDLDTAPTILRLPRSGRARVAQIVHDSSRHSPHQTLQRLQREAARLEIAGSLVPEPPLTEANAGVQLQEVISLIHRARWWPEQAAGGRGDQEALS